MISFNHKDTKGTKKTRMGISLVIGLYAFWGCQHAFGAPQNDLQGVSKQLQVGAKGGQQVQKGNFYDSARNMNYEVQLFQGNAASKLTALMAEAKDGNALKEDLGRRCANELREHFAKRNVEGPRNKLGATSSGFWGEIGGKVDDGKISGDDVVVSIHDPRLAQRVYGGPIKMDDHLLAIPARPEAYGKSPRLFSNLKAVFFEHGAALIQFKPAEPKKPGEKRIGGKKDEDIVFYWLVKETRPQAADPHALPGREQLTAALLDTAAKNLRRVLS